MHALQVPGLFTMQAEPRWSPTGNPDWTFELVDGEDAIAQISAVERPPGTIRSNEARELLAQFATAAGRLTGVDHMERTGEQRASGRVTGEDVDRLFAVVVWPTTIVWCSCAARPGSDGIAAAARLFGSITRVPD